MGTDKKNLDAGSGAKNSRRSAARLAAVQALYQMDVAGTDLNDVLREFRSDYFSGAAIEDGDDGDGDGNPSTDAESGEATQLDHGFLADDL